MGAGSMAFSPAATTGILPGGKVQGQTCFM